MRSVGYLEKWLRWEGKGKTNACHVKSMKKNYEKGQNKEKPLAFQKKKTVSWLILFGKICVICVLPNFEGKKINIY